VFSFPSVRAIDWWDFEFERISVPATSTAGTPYRRSVAIGMPRIPPQVLYSTFHLYPTVAAANAGDKFGGTGFFVSYPTGVPEAPYLLYAVTNWHVAVRDGFSVVRVNTHDGTDIFDLDPADWEFIPGGPDMAVVPHRRLGIKESTHQVIALSVDMFLTRHDVVELEINSGEDIFMIGRFVDHDGSTNYNVPSGRFGNISVLPQDVIQPTGGKAQSFILDVHSRTGYSGSPVFVYRTFGSDLTTDVLQLQELNILGLATATPFSHFIKLLGLHWGQFPEQWEIKTKAKSKLSTEALLDQKNERYVEGMSGMTLAIPAWIIRDFLDMPKMKKEREEALKEILSARGSGRVPITESASPPANGENPTHREDFTRLVGAAARKPKQED
jgi:hypothetical protein